jgi:hypothetical protein
MAVTIVGSGSITGLSAGGLPTGSVTADSLATNSVDSAELVSGAVDSSHLASGVGGKVLQVVSTLKTDKYSSTTATGSITGMSVTITPASTSNTILLMSHLTLAVPSTGTGWSFHWKRGSTKIGVGSDGSRTPQGFAETYDSDTNTATTVAYHCVDSPNTTSAITYQLDYEKFNGAATLKVNTNTTMGGQSYDDIFTSGVIVMEISG